MPLPAIPAAAFMVFNTGISFAPAFLTADPWNKALINVDKAYAYAGEGTQYRQPLDAGGGHITSMIGQASAPQRVEWTVEGETFVNVAMQLLGERSSVATIVDTAGIPADLREALQAYGRELATLAQAAADLVDRFELIKRDYRRGQPLPNHYPNTPRHFTNTLKRAMDARDQVSRAVRALSKPPSPSSSTSSSPAAATASPQQQQALLQQLLSHLAPQPSSLVTRSPGTLVASSSPASPGSGLLILAGLAVLAVVLVRRRGR